MAWLSAEMFRTIALAYLQRILRTASGLMQHSTSYLHASFDSNSHTNNVGHCLLGKLAPLLCMLSFVLCCSCMTSAAAAAAAA